MGWSVNRDPAELDQHGGALNDLLRKLPDEVKRGSDAAVWSRADGLRELLDEIEPLLVGRLLAEVDPA